MKAIKFTTLAIFIGLAVEGAALAAPAARQDNSSLVVWLFLGFCALIVVAQIVPLLRNLRLFARQSKELPLQASPAKSAGDTRRSS